MRKNNTYIPSVPLSRNEFIEMVNSKKDVILVNSDLLKILSKEINDSIDGRRAGKLGTRCGPVMLALSWWNPIGLVLSGVVLLSGLVGISADALRRYEIYSGENVAGEPIITLHYKTVNLKYDTIKYPDWVKTINLNKANKKVKSQ